MNNEERKIGIYALSGILMASLIIGGIFVSGIQFPSFSMDTFPTAEVHIGTLIVLLKDAPVDLRHLNLTIDNLAVHNVENETWIDIPFANGTEEVYFDLLALENVTMPLSIADIPTGNYTKIRMEVKTANATFSDGDTADLTVPPGHIDIKIHFEIKSNNTTVLLIDIEADLVKISHSLNLNPQFEANVIYQP
jgi:hypothetical protein